MIPRSSDAFSSNTILSGYQTQPGLTDKTTYEDSCHKVDSRQLEWLTSCQSQVDQTTTDVERSSDSSIVSLQPIDLSYISMTDSHTCFHNFRPSNQLIKRLWTIFFHPWQRVHFYWNNFYISWNDLFVNSANVASIVICCFCRDLTRSIS